ncbi:MAG: GNAT family N-acetyltransferase [Chitinophagales bacterium]
MTKVKVFNALQPPSDAEKQKIVQFLKENLEQYGDAAQDIRRAIDYSVKEIISFGGFTLVAEEGGEIAGAVVVNRTGMSGYIPENILVYIATHKDMRGKGIGKKLMDEALHNAKGDIALHVEANNPAKFLYEKYGFTNPYLEMRLKRN